MPGPYITTDALKARLADFVQVSGGELVKGWESIAADSLQAAYGEIVGTLAGRGYTLAQIDQWGRRFEFQIDLALWWCGVKGAWDQGDVNPTVLKELDRRAALQTVAVTGEEEAGILAPAASPVGGGPLDTKNDAFFWRDPYGRKNPWD